MIQTIYPASYADQISIFDFNMRPGPSEWARPDCPPPYQSCAKGVNPGRTHRFLNGKVCTACCLPCCIYVLSALSAALHCLLPCTNTVCPALFFNRNTWSACR